MSWLRIAADLIRSAINPSESRPEPQGELPAPEDINGVIDLFNRHRADVHRGFDAVSKMIQAQNTEHLQAIRIQRRWNYGLLTALLILAAVVVLVYFRE
jgi:hypothetical protein